MLAAIYRNIAKAWLAETEMNKYKYYLSCNASCSQETKHLYFISKN